MGTEKIKYDLCAKKWENKMEYSRMLTYCNGIVSVSVKLVARQIHIIILDIDRQTWTILGFCYATFVWNGCEYNYINTNYNFVLKFMKKFKRK